MAMPSSFEYIVVGAGSSGCVVASRLSARSTVLLPEAGPPDSGMLGGEDIGALVRDPKNVILTTWNPDISRRYETVGQANLAGRRIIINRGVVRGGCSTVNGMIYIRGNRRDDDTRAQLGCDGWSFREVLPLLHALRGLRGAATRVFPRGPRVPRHDPELRVYGVDGLRVADASIIPVIPSGNINAACIMIGERCADLAAS